MTTLTTNLHLGKAQTGYVDNSLTYLTSTLPAALDAIDLAIGRVFDVTVPKYGALGNGVHDDTTAIRSAIADASAAGGGTVVVPGGPTKTYLIGPSLATYSLTLASGVNIVGDGATLKRKTANTEKLIGASAALTDVRIYGLVVDNDDAVVAQGMLFVPNGSARITVEQTRFIGLAYISAVWFDTGTVQGSDLTLYRCSFERTLANNTAANENIGIVWIHDASGVTVEDCLFDTVGALEVFAYNGTACPATAPMNGVKIIGNRFRGIKTTSMFVSAINSASLDNVQITGNQFLTVGKDLEKGAIQAQQNGSGHYSNLVIEKNQIRDFGYAGSTSIGATTNAAQAVNIGVSGAGTQSGVVIQNNTIDAAAPDGTAVTGGNIGISVGGGVTDVTVKGNTIRNCGWAGIRIWGGTLIQSVVIDGNVVDSCVLIEDTTDKPGGIHLQDNCQDVLIVANNIRNCGPASRSAACEAAGITLNTPTSPTTIHNTTIVGNRITDTRTGGSRTQLYGVKIGDTASAAASQPSGIVASGNFVDNHVTADWFYQTSVDLSYRITARALNVASDETVNLRGKLTTIDAIQFVANAASPSTAEIYKSLVSGIAIRATGGTTSDYALLSVAGTAVGYVPTGTNDFRFVGKVGFYDTAPVAKPTVSGAKAGNAALTSLIAALVALGAITDTTT